MKQQKPVQLTANDFHLIICVKLSTELELI